MGISAVGQYAAVQNAYTPQKKKTAAPVDDKKVASATKDTVTISGNADHLQALQKQFPKMRSDPEAADKVEEKTEEEAQGDQTGTSGRVGINAAKLARMLAAAKTRSQVQAVIAKIEADLRECDAGKAQGMDVDEASVRAAEQLLSEARSRLGSAESREATTAEEMASALASLM